MPEKKINVVLVCAAGMSSSLLEQKIRQAAQAAGRDMELRAVNATTMALMEFEKENIDIILVAPQVRFKKRGIMEKAEPLGILVQDIDTVAYGMMDGEKIFTDMVNIFDS